MIRFNDAPRQAMVFVSLVALLEALLLVLPLQLNTAMFMLVPAAAALLTMSITGEILRKAGWQSLGFHAFSKQFFMIGLLAPMILIGFSYIIVWAAGWGTFGLSGEYEGRGVELAIQFVVALIGGAVTVVLGEELGWRGYLLPRLQGLGMRRSLIWSSVIWGLFHLPIMLFTNLYHNDVNLYVYIPLFMVNVLLAGIFIGYLRLKSSSIWPALIAHSCHNLCWQYGDLFTQHQSSIVKYITGDAGLLLIMGYALVIFLLTRKQKEQAAVSTLIRKNSIH